jgi:hypothetical protein
MITPDDVEREIMSELLTASSVGQQFGWDNRAWTRGVKNAIVAVGKRLNHRTAGNGCDSDDGCEWLYDVLWYKVDDAFLRDVLLVAESEWGDLKAIKCDFEKLLVARADHRVMVFESNGIVGIRDIVANIVAWVRNYRRSERTDRFLLAGWAVNHWQFFLIVGGDIEPLSLG